MVITMKLDEHAAYARGPRPQIAISLVVQVTTSIAIPSPTGMINSAWLAEGARASRLLPSAQSSSDWTCAREAYHGMRWAKNERQ